MKRARRRAPPKPRNPVARSPLLGKGGVHQNSRGAARRQERMALQQLVRTPADDKD
jgi:hypothetical protein